MRKSTVATLLVAGALATMATSAFAAFSDRFDDGIAKARKLSEASRATRLQSQSHGANDTTFVGQNDNMSTADNPWHVGVGDYHYGTTRTNTSSLTNHGGWGYWDWDNPINGDSLQGWWPIRHMYSSGTAMPGDDRLRPWYALQSGNAVNYVINQGVGNGFGGGKRTFGVVGVWHADPGGDGVSESATKMNPGAGVGTPGYVNPRQPNVPVIGTRAAWCGLRSHGDRTVSDAITGSPFTVEAVPITLENGIGTSGGGTGRRFPGYLGIMDQYLYRDVNISARGNNPVRFRFQLRTRMSASFITSATTRTGWTLYDQTSMIEGAGNVNFISSTVAGVNAPRDSFSVYVGKGIEPVSGPNNDYQPANVSLGMQEIFDPLRRSLSEIVKIDYGAADRLVQIYGSAGNLDNLGTAGTGTGFGTVNCGATDAQLDAIGVTSLRFVARVHTNRSGNTPSDDENGSVNGTYNSGYGGAAVLDNVEVSTDDGVTYTTIGDFEPASGAGNNIDNSVGAGVSWRSTGKPPAIYPHVRNIADVGYSDLCGPALPSNPRRACNMYNIVLSMGEYPTENKAGDPGTVDLERWDSIMSPTICLQTTGTGPNNMGITADMANATEDYYTLFDWNTAAANSSIEGCFYQSGFQCYPAKQQDGQRCWSDWQRPGFISSEDLDLCNTYISYGGYNYGLIYTTNANFIPDSIRTIVRKLTYCYRFAPSNCGDAGKAYAYDNVTFTMIDGAAAQPLSTSFWLWIQDTFPSNELSTLPGTAQFDTCAAWIQNGLNATLRPNTTTRVDIPGDTTVVVVGGATVRLDCVFRIDPGVGNFVKVGDRATGLTSDPRSHDVNNDNGTPIVATDNSFWTSYINNNGTYGSLGGHPATGPFEKRWSSLVWNSARCDTADFITFPVEAVGWGQTAVGGLLYATMYHESELWANQTLGPNTVLADGVRGKLAQPRGECFLQNPAGVQQSGNINCGRAVEAGVGPYPPAWVSNPGTGAPILSPYWTSGPGGTPQSVEGTKMFPDGVFTPGTHIEYFFRRLDTTTLDVSLMPDTNYVLQPGAGGDTDGFRWQHASVLPDAWKKIPYGGLGEACMLYIDWNDGRGNERVWVSVADSIGATDASKFGAHNGWHAAGQQVFDADVDNPANFVYNKNAQPGTTWDLYGVKAGEAGADASGSIGARASTSGTVYATGKDARNAPTNTMLGQYSMLFITTGTLLNDILGPFLNRSQDDFSELNNYLNDGTASDIRGLFIMGDGFIEAIDPVNADPYGDQLGQVQPLLNAALTATNYLGNGGSPDPTCQDLTVLAPISSNGDVYGFNNNCQASLDVLDPMDAGGQKVITYPVGNMGAGILHPVNGAATEYWISLVTGFKLNDVRSRFCGSSYGRLRFMYDALNLFQSVISGTCSLTGAPTVTLDVPESGSGKKYVDFMNLKNNPLIQGEAVIGFGLAKSDRVTLKVYDVTGRLVRTLLDKQLFQAGIDHKVTWDGVDNAGRMVPRGVYFSSFETSAGRSFQRKMTVLK